MTKITLHDSQEPFTPNRDRSAGFYRKRDDAPKFDPQGEPEAVAVPEFLKDSDPQADYEAIIAELKAQLAAKDEAKPDEAPKWSGDEEPPAELSDLISYYDTPAEANEKLLVRLREVLGLIGLAEDAGGRAAPELYRKKDRLESGIRWNRGRLAGTI